MNRLTVAPVGDLDTTEVDALRLSILQALGPGPAQVHFDASRVGFTGAAFLGLLAELGQLLQADGGGLSVAGANAATERIMRLCGMGQLLVAGGPGEAGRRLDRADRSRDLPGWQSSESEVAEWSRT